METLRTGAHQMVSVGIIRRELVNEPVSVSV